MAAVGAEVDCFDGSAVAGHGKLGMAGEGLDVIGARYKAHRGEEQQAHHKQEPCQRYFGFHTGLLLFYVKTEVIVCYDYEVASVVIAEVNLEVAVACVEGADVCVCGGGGRKFCQGNSHAHPLAGHSFACSAVNDGNACLFLLEDRDGRCHSRGYGGQFVQVHFVAKLNLAQGCFRVDAFGRGLGVPEEVVVPPRGIGLEVCEVARFHGYGATCGKRGPAPCRITAEIVGTPAPVDSGAVAVEVLVYPVVAVEGQCGASAKGCHGEYAV